MQSLPSFASTGDWNLSSSSKCNAGMTIPTGCSTVNNQQLNSGFITVTYETVDSAVFAYNNHSRHINDREIELVFSTQMVTIKRQSLLTHLQHYVQKPNEPYTRDLWVGWKPSIPTPNLKKQFLAFGAVDQVELFQS